MLVKAKVKCFVGGSLREEGAVFEYPKLTKHLEEVAGVAISAEPAVELTKDDIRAKLAEYGVKAAPQTSREKLLDKLREAEGEVMPEEVI